MMHARRHRVQLVQKEGQLRRTLLARRHEVIVVGKERPRLRPPPKLRREIEERVVQQIETLARPEEELLVQRRADNAVSPNLLDIVERCMMPIPHTSTLPRRPEEEINF